MWPSICCLGKTTYALRLRQRRPAYPASPTRPLPMRTTALGSGTNVASSQFSAKRKSPSTEPDSPLISSVHWS